MKKVFLFISLLFIGQIAFPAHLIGGSMSYKSLGANNYQLTVEILRDCFGGGAAFDETINVTIFDENNDVAEVIEIALDTLFTVYNPFDPDILQCLIPSNICVEKALYTIEINLADTSEFYTFSFQRCCLSSTIVNFSEVADNGMTFTIALKMNEENSSPQFNQDFPLGIGVNIPFFYDASAYDIDGDSLVYSMSTPFIGGSSSLPVVNISEPPPFIPNSYADNYSEENMLGSLYSLNIDSQTGIIFGLSEVQGSYLIGYKVEEYRNGLLLSTTYRTFVFAVGLAEDNTNFDISGRVFVNDSIPIDEGKVLLLEIDLLADSLYVFDEQDVDENANYSFEAIPPGIFLLRAFVSENSQYFEQYVPTYIDSSIVWYQSTPINQCDSTQESRDIYLINVDDTEGDISFDGYVLDSFFGFMPMDFDLENMTLILLNEEGNPVRSSGIDSEDHFQFSNLTAGTYTLYVDLFNYPFNESNAPVITLNSNRRANITIYPDYVDIDFSLAIGEAKVEQIQVYPNPTKGIIYINAGGNQLNKITLYSIDGKVIFKEKDSKIDKQIAIEGAPGIYLLEIESDKVLSYYKIIKE